MFDTFRKLIGQVFGRPATDVDGAEQEPAPATHISAAPLEPRIDIGTGQSTGLERSHNEDALLVLSGRSAGQQSLPDFGVYIVADGMGGHRAGEVASAVSVRTVGHRLTEKTILQLLEQDTNSSEVPLQELIREALEEANDAVVELVPGGGTTLTAAVLLGHQITIGHVGDSRAYVMENGKAEVVTRDHSLVERLRELGQLTPEEVATHPQRNVLYRAIGQGPSLEVDVLSFSAPSGGYLMLCSDGLWGVVPDPYMLNIIDQAASPQEACEELVQAANDAGGPDNITVILVQFPEK
jgi:protein phosphatase